MNCWTTGSRWVGRNRPPPPLRSRHVRPSSPAAKPARTVASPSSSLAPPASSTAAEVCCRRSPDYPEHPIGARGASFLARGQKAGRNTGIVLQKRGQVKRLPAGSKTHNKRSPDGRERR